jgi:hypothetical protein
MRTQALTVIVIFTAAVIAVPQFYSLRTSADASPVGFVSIMGIVAFLGGPFLAGILQPNVNRTMLLATGILFSLCPLVSIVTNPLAIQFERLRDSYYLATGATVLFVSTTWLAYSFRSRNWLAMFAAVAALLFAVTAVFTMVWIFIYFE